jgi:hypothetical protein
MSSVGPVPTGRRTDTQSWPVGTGPTALENRRFTNSG